MQIFTEVCLRVICRLIRLRSTSNQSGHHLYTVLAADWVIQTCGSRIFTFSKESKIRNSKLWKLKGLTIYSLRFSVRNKKFKNNVCLSCLGDSEKESKFKQIGSLSGKVFQVNFDGYCMHRIKTHWRTGFQGKEKWKQFDKKRFSCSASGRHFEVLKINK